jgi:Rrf2 family protein
LLALKPEGEMTPINELTARLDIPYHFLAKILQDLTKKGVLSSSKGRGGGFSLPKASQESTLYRIITAVDGDEFMHACVMGFRECSATSPCALHARWSHVREEIYSMLVSKSIYQLAGEIGNARLPVDTSRGVIIDVKSDILTRLS